MKRIIYVNGSYVADKEAKISVFDRGFLMADGVYEVVTVIDGRLIDFDAHMHRLWNSMAELSLSAPCDKETLLEIHRALIKANNLHEGMVYLQVTRGVADRDFCYPDNATPSLVAFTQEKNILINQAVSNGIKVISIEDMRWKRRDIKTVQLLYSSMAKMAAKTAQCDDAWLVQDGLVTEGSSNNAYIINGDVIITRALSVDILAGITRAAVLKFAKSTQMQVEIRSFSIKEAQAADEAFITSASTFVMPVIAVDNVAIGTGKPGPLTMDLRQIYINEAYKTAL